MPRDDHDYEDDEEYEARRRRRRRRDEEYDDDDDEEDDRPRRRRRRESQDIGDDPAMRLILPVGQSTWAIVSGYLGLFSVLCLPAPFALFTGIMAIREIRNNPKKHGWGRAIFGVVMGGLGTLGMIAAVIIAIINPK